MRVRMKHLRHRLQARCIGRLGSRSRNFVKQLGELRGRSEQHPLLRGEGCRPGLRGPGITSELCLSALDEEERSAERITRMPGSELTIHELELNLHAFK